MPSAEFRFYEELNDFLPVHRRKQPFTHACARRATVKQAIEALGVPHPEVELILVNGESVDFSHVVRAGDRVSVYPKFECLDISPLLRVRAGVLREVRFVADAHLGALAKYLRMLGFDTRYDPSLGDAPLARIAAREDRILLTRDRDLLMHRIVTHGCYVRPSRPLDQLEHVVSRLQLERMFAPFSRCMECNAVLEPVARQAVRDRLPPGAAGGHDRYHRCPGCDRIYWPGSHYERMRELVERLRAASSGRAAGGRGARVR